MFLSPLLYAAYALLYGIIAFITVAAGFRAGFSFSAGVTDLVFSSALPAAANTWLILPLGILAFVLFYAVFRFMIRKWHLKTPGLEEETAPAQESPAASSRSADNKYAAMARTILRGLGGPENLLSIDNCITRLRLEIRDMGKVDDGVIRSAGAAGLIRPGKNALQIVIGTSVQFVADELKLLCGPQAPAASGQDSGQAAAPAPVAVRVSGTHRRVTVNDLIFEQPDGFAGGDHFDYTITDPTGIHARPAGEIAGIAGRYDCEVAAEANGKRADARSVVALMSLGTAKGTRITFRASGPECTKALSDLYQFVKEHL